MEITKENSYFQSSISHISASCLLSRDAILFLVHKKGLANQLALMRGVAVYCENGKRPVHELWLGISRVHIYNMKREISWPMIDCLRIWIENSLSSICPGFWCYIIVIRDQMKMKNWRKREIYQSIFHQTCLEHTPSFWPFSFLTLYCWWVCSVRYQIRSRL